MIRIKWDIIEAVVLMGVYFQAATPSAISDLTLLRLSEMYKRKASQSRIKFDEKFRNLTGLKMQLNCIHFVATNGREGMPNASKIFYKAYELYKNNPKQFKDIQTGLL